MRIERQQTQLYLTKEERDILTEAQSICYEISRETDHNYNEDELEIYKTAFEIAIEIQNLMGIVKGNTKWL